MALCYLRNSDIEQLSSFALNIPIELATLFHNKFTPYKFVVQGVELSIEIIVLFYLNQAETRQKYDQDKLK